MLKIRGCYFNCTTMRILILADDLEFTQELKDCLEPDFIIDTVTSSSQGVYASQADFYSLILLDNSFENIRGSQICSLIRRNNVSLPILMFTDSPKVSSRVTCLRFGADDCLARPFDAEELRARIKALTRRFSTNIPKDNIYRIGDLSVDFWNRVVRHKEKTFFLCRKEFELLELLIKNRNHTLTRDFIFESLWDERTNNCSNAVDVYICCLRKKLRDLACDDVIRTIYGIGYVFDDSGLRKGS